MCPTPIKIAKSGHTACDWLKENQLLVSQTGELKKPLNRTLNDQRFYHHHECLEKDRPFICASSSRIRRQNATAYSWFSRRDSHDCVKRNLRILKRGKQRHAQKRERVTPSLKREKITQRQFRNIASHYTYCCPPARPTFLPTYLPIYLSLLRSLSISINWLTHSSLFLSPYRSLSLSCIHAPLSLCLSLPIILSLLNLSPYRFLSLTHTHILSMSLYLIKLSCFLNFGCCTRYLGVRLTLKTEEMPFRLFHFFRLWPDVRIDACNERVTVV